VGLRLGRLSGVLSVVSGAGADPQGSPPPYVVPVWDPVWFFERPVTHADGGGWETEQVGGFQTSRL